MYCNLCRTKFEPWKTKHGWIEDKICPLCVDKKQSKAFTLKDKNMYCVNCGAVLAKYKTQTRAGKVYYTSAKHTLCDNCKKPKRITEICLVCGEKLIGKQKKYCLKCKPPRPKINPITNRRSSIKWLKNNHEKAKVSWLARYRYYRVNVLYECPCNHPNKHDHHFDYDRPFEVIRLCPACHSAEHKRLRELENDALEINIGK